MSAMRWNYQMRAICLMVSYLLLLWFSLHTLKLSFGYTYIYIHIQVHLARIETNVENYQYVRFYLLSHRSHYIYLFHYFGANVHCEHTEAEGQSELNDLEFNSHVHLNVVSNIPAKSEAWTSQVIWNHFQFWFLCSIKKLLENSSNN